MDEDGLVAGGGDVEIANGDPGAGADGLAALPGPAPPLFPIFLNDILNKIIFYHNLK